MVGVSGLDWAIIGIYFGGVIALGFYLSRKAGGNSGEYFLAGRNVGWFAVGASLIATNISSEHFIGLAGAGAESGLAMGHFEWQACLILLLLGWVFAPFYLRNRLFTMPEFLERRFDARSRWYLTTISIVAYVITKISVTLYAGALLLEVLLGWDKYLSAFILVIATGAYTVVGGLRAVIYTEVVQTLILIAGAILITVLGLIEVGGFDVLRAKVPDLHFQMFRPMSDPDFPWTGVVFGAPIVSIWYWCTDQYIAQRVLSAQNVTEARQGTIFAGYLKLLPVFILILPGMIAHVLYPDVTGDKAYPELLTRLLPTGVKGIVIAGLLAALMSSLASCFNSVSTLFTFDVYQKLNPNASDQRLLRVGKIATVVIVLLGIAWIGVLNNMNAKLYTYMQTIQSYVSPPIAVVFMAGIFWWRANANGAIVTLLGGMFLGLLRFGLEVIQAGSPLESPVLVWLVSMNFMHYAIFLLGVCIVLMVGVSLITSPPPVVKLQYLTYRYAPPLEPIDKRTQRLNGLLSAGLVIILLFLWAWFF